VLLHGKRIRPPEAGGTHAANVSTEENERKSLIRLNNEESVDCKSEQNEANDSDPEVSRATPVRVGKNEMYRQAKQDQPTRNMRNPLTCRASRSEI